MAMHFFHVRDGARVDLDTTGCDCADLAAAKRHAVALAADRGERAASDEWQIEIADVAGQYLARVDSQGVVSD